MSDAATKKVETVVVRVPQRTWRRRWWLLSFVAAFVIIFLCYHVGQLWVSHQREKFNQFLLQLSEQGIKVDIRSVDDRFSWLLRYQKYLPEFLTELLKSQEASVTLVGDKITSDSLDLLARLPNVTSLSFEDTPYIDDDSLIHLSNLKTLKNITIDNTSLSGEGFVHLQNLPKLAMIQIQPAYVRKILPKKRLTEKGIDQLLEMTQAIYAGDLKAESVQPGTVEVTGPNNAKSLKVGDVVTFRGSFTSTHFVTKDFYALYSWQNDDHSQPEELAQLYRILSEDQAKGPVTKGANGVYHFNITSDLRLKWPGRYTAAIFFTVEKKDPSSSYASNIWFTLGTKEFEVKK